MATVYGLTDLGFVPKTLEVVRAELEQAIIDLFGPSMLLGDKTILGQLIGIIAERESALWDLGQALYNALDPDGATKSALDGVCRLTGTVRPAASKSASTLTLTGIPTTLCPVGTTASISGTTRFETIADATIVLVASWASGTAYALADRVTNGGNVYQCSQAGTSAGSGGPSGTGTGIVDNGAKWDFLGAGTGAVDQVAQCTVTGPLAALARTITQKESAVSGWQGVINVNDAVVGRNIATDEELRILRTQELALSGGGTAAAIRAALLALSTVEAVTVFENPADVADVNGVPAHGVEVMVQSEAGATDEQNIRDTIFANVSAGIVTHGNVTGTSTDSQGTTHEIDFSRPVEKQVYVAITLVKDPTVYPPDGDTQVATAIATFGASLPSGKDVVSSSLLAQAFKVLGVLDVTACNIGLSPSPTTNTTIAIALRELATYSTSRITVSSSNGTP